MTEVVDHNSRQDELEALMLAYPKVECPLDHVFTDGLYSRTILMPAGTMVSSRIHKTQHQFVVSKGCALVRVNDEEWQKIEAPFLGITEAGTRRILLIISDCVWSTFHPVDIKPEDESEESVQLTVNQIDQLILEQHINEVLGGQLKNNVLINALK